MAVMANRLRTSSGVTLITPLRLVALLSFSLVSSSAALAQAIPAATQPIHLSAFGGITGSYTGLQSSRNLGITAGVDVGFKPLFGVYPSAELRGTYPVDSGTVAGERNFAGGLKVERPYFGILHPYADILFGRNKIVYGSGGYPNANGTLLYQISIANLLSFGGGADYDLTPHFSAKADFQLQRYGTPVTSSGSIYAKAITIGVVYRFDFNRHFNYDRKTGQVTNLPKQPPPPPASRVAPPPTPSPENDTPPADAAPTPASAPEPSSPPPTPPASTTTQPQ
jgi:hypothetical protein